MIVDQARYRDGSRLPCSDIGRELDAVRSDRAGAAGRHPVGDFVWVGLKDPSEASFDKVAGDEVHIHPLAIEDAVHGGERPKLERYGDSWFAVLRPLRYVEESSDVETGELMVFLAEDYLLTVRRGDAGPLADLRSELEDHRPESLRHGPWGVLHAILDRVVDEYLDIADQVQDDLDEIEEGVFSVEGQVTSAEIYRLKREVLEFKRAAVPLQRVLGQLTGAATPVPEGELRLLFRDVADHLAHVVDATESQDGLLSDVLDAHLAQVGVQQNMDMRKISAWVAIAALPTMIAGIYGMNFQRIPELTASVRVGGREVYYGYYVVITVMVLACLLLYRTFRRAGWLGSWPGTTREEKRLAAARRQGRAEGDSSSVS